MISCFASVFKNSVYKFNKFFINHKLLWHIWFHKIREFSPGSGVEEGRLCHHTQIMGANNLSSFYTKTWFSSHDILRHPPLLPHHGENRKQDAARPGQAGALIIFGPWASLLSLSISEPSFTNYPILDSEQSRYLDTRYSSRLPWCRHIDLKCKVSREPSLIIVFSCIVWPPNFLFPV